MITGINYDGLTAHGQEVAAQGEHKWSDLRAATSEEEFFGSHGRHVVSELDKEMAHFGLALESDHRDPFFKTINDLRQLDPQPTNSWQDSAIAECLSVHQGKFFGSRELDECRQKFIEAALRLTPVSSPFASDPYPKALEGYVRLVGFVEEPKLYAYVNMLLRGHSFNCNLAAPLSKGLPVVLLNLNLPAANLFVSETFELLAVEETSTPGLADAVSYILLRTPAAFARFKELIGESA